MTHYTLQIPKPCSEDWNQMTRVEQGRFCAVCKKEVYDFSSYTKRELVQHLKREGKICGRVPARFIDSELKDSIAFSGLKVKGMVVTAINLLVLTATTTADGQEKITTEQTEKQTTKGLETENRDHQLDSIAKRILKGQVCDEDGIPLPGAGVIIEGTNCGVGTDYEGNFQLEIPNEFIKNKILFQFIGMETQRIKIRNFEKPLQIILKEDTENMMGEFVVIHKKKKWLFF